MLIITVSGGVLCRVMSSHCGNLLDDSVQDIEPERKDSMLVLSEFVGCSPSLSGAIRVNPWSIDDVADGLYTAIKMPLPERHARHDKHWRYVSHHTAAFWAKVAFQKIK